MKDNQDYKNEALATLEGNWSPALVCTIILSATTAVISAVGSILMKEPLLYDIAVLPVCLLFVAPLATGLLNSTKALYRDGDRNILQNSFSLGFKNYWHIVGGVALTFVFVSLWSLLLVIPGIIKAYSYAMTPYIIVDNPELSPNQAINRSCEMMKGHKADLFFFHLSFIGWMILSVLTLGIGYFWLVPYMYTAQAAFYTDIKAEYESKRATIEAPQE